MLTDSTGQQLAKNSSPVVLASDQSAIAVTSTPGTLGQAAMAASAPVVIASNQTAVPVSGTVTASGVGYTSQVSVTRPATTPTYTANDVMGATAAAITFTSIGPAAGHIIITSADLRIDISAVTSGMTSFRLYLYNVTPPSALADDAAWDLPSGDRASFLGYIDLGTPVDVGSTLFVQTATDFRKEIPMGASTSLFGYLVTAGSFVATSAAVHSIRLNAVGC